MNSLNRSLTPTARRIAKTILNGFEAYFADFQNLTLGAKARFETAAWQSILEAHRLRLDMYKSKVVQVLELVEGVTSKDISSLDLWGQAKEAYAQLIDAHANYEIAETFFNSVFCLKFSHHHIHDRNIFVLPSAEESPGKLLKDYSIYLSYQGKDGIEQLVTQILDDFEFSTPWEDKQRDIANLAAVIRDDILAVARQPAEHLVIDILESVFYRNKAAYLVGRGTLGDMSFPVIIPCRNNERGGIFTDALIHDSDSASIIFSFTRSYFMVEAPIPSRFVRFLNGLMPNKTRAELYNSLGLNKHGKTEFYRHIIDHMRNSSDHYIIAPGIKGMVMSVFTLPSYDMVFKVIKDRFDPPKTATEQQVKDQYKLVSRADKAGRMADTQEYSNFIFYRNRFSEELLEELQRVAPSKIELVDKWVIIKHLYVERRMVPLNMYIAHASDAEVDMAMDEYGNCIKQLALANIFTGDMLLKNFGVTRHGRVVFYDYDEIMLITDCHFRKIPEPRTPEQEMADRPWYPIADNDIFPEEFRLFFSGNPKARQSFEKYHSDIYDYRYWQRIQDGLRQGHVEDTFPYRKKQRFKH